MAPIAVSPPAANRTGPPSGAWSTAARPRSRSKPGSSRPSWIGGGRAGAGSPRSARRATKSRSPPASTRASRPARRSASWVPNADARSKDYDDLKDLYRPSRAVYTCAATNGVRDHRGEGRASYREAIGRVAGGAIARKLLDVRVGIEIVGYVLRIDDLLGVVDRETVDRDLVESNIVWCPDGVVARIVPVGLGEPVFDKLTTDFANVLMSIPASRGFEVGEGFGSVGMRGSTHNDPFIMKGRRVGSRTNHSGGISNGEPIVLRVAFKPTATISREQETVTRRESRPHFAPAAGTIRACSPTRWRPWRPWSRSCWPIICSERLRFGGVAPSVC